MALIKKLNQLLIVIITLTLFSLIIGVTYSYFRARIIGGETDKTITANSGDMDIVFDGGDSITANRLIPSYNPFGSKVFTVTGTSNIIDSEMGYEITLIIDENTFSNEGITYTLTSENTTGNGAIVDSILERQPVGTSNVILGNGKFIGNVTNEVHTYILKVYFYETGENQSNDMDKTFKAHIGIENYVEL